MYKGRTLAYPPPATDGKYSFIDIKSVTEEDGAPITLKTDKDIFIHADTLGGTPLRAGMEMFFDVIPDEKRGDGAYKAVNAMETPTSGLANLATGGIQLRVQGAGNSRTIENSSVFATWCITPALAPKLRQLKLEGKVVRLLLIQWQASLVETSYNRHQSSEETRQLVELTDPMVPLGFTASGKHRVVALIVWGQNASSLEEWFLGRRYGRTYDVGIMSMVGNSIRLDQDSGNMHWFGTGCIDVEMPEGLFAKRPSDWEWVNKVFKSGPRDQCAYRWRRLFAYTLQPIGFLVIAALFAIFMPLYYLFLMLSTLAILSLGIRDLDYGVLRHPLSSNVGTLLPYRPTSRLVQWHGKQRNMFPLVFSPTVVLGAALLAFIVASAGAHALVAWSWSDFGLIYGSTVVAWALISLVVYVNDGEPAEPIVLVDADLIDQELERLVCDGSGPHTANVWSLSFRPKNFRFFFLGAKQKVCKNFSSV